MREDLSQHEAVSPCLTAWLHRVPAIEKDSQFLQCQLNVQAQLHGWTWCASDGLFSRTSSALISSKLQFGLKVIRLEWRRNFTNAGQSLMATSNSPTYGQSNSPRQDG